MAGEILSLKRKACPLLNEGRASLICWLITNTDLIRVNVGPGLFLFWQKMRGSKLKRPRNDDAGFPLETCQELIKLLSVAGIDNVASRVAASGL